MLGTVLYVPEARVGDWLWLDKEHPFKLVQRSSSGTTVGYCGVTQYVFEHFQEKGGWTLRLIRILTPGKQPQELTKTCACCGYAC